MEGSGRPDYESRVGIFHDFASLRSLIDKPYRHFLLRHHPYCEPNRHSQGLQNEAHRGWLPFPIRVNQRFTYCDTTNTKPRKTFQNIRRLESEKHSVSILLLPVSPVGTRGPPSGFHSLLRINVFSTPRWTHIWHVFSGLLVHEPGSRGISDRTRGPRACEREIWARRREYWISESFADM